VNLNDLMYQQMLDREQAVIATLPPELRKPKATVASVEAELKKSTVRQITADAKAFGLPVEAMLTWNVVSGHYPVQQGVCPQQDRFLLKWNVDRIKQKEFPHDHATDVHTHSYSPGVVFFTYPVGVMNTPTKLQATAVTLANPIMPAAYDPRGNIVGITNETAETIRAALRASI